MREVRKMTALLERLLTDTSVRDAVKLEEVVREYAGEFDPWS